MKTLFSLMIGMYMLNAAQGQTDTKHTLAIGDHFGGGIIFSLDPSGQHGLIAAPYDNPIKAFWGDEILMNATYVNDGNTNTEKIVTAMNNRKHPSVKKPATCFCDSLTLGAYTDWYLPSINELKVMYDKQMIIGNFIAGIYWSSTESKSSKSFTVNFTPGRKKVVKEYWKLEAKYSFRCMRKF